MSLESIRRQLAKTATPKQETEAGGPQGMMAVVAEAQAEIKAAKAAQQKAEDKAAELQKRLDGMHSDMAKAQAGYASQLESVRRDAEQTAAKWHAKGIEALQLKDDKITELRNKLSAECEQRAGAEATVREMTATRQSLERQLNKPAPAPAPVVVPPQAPRPAPVPLEVAVSQRDQNGRIVSLMIKPAT